MGLEMTIEFNDKVKIASPTLGGFKNEMALIEQHFTPTEAVDLLWHAKIASEVASRTINVKFSRHTHPNIHLFNVIKDLGREAKGYAVPTNELVPRVVSKLAFPNVSINAPKGVDKHAFESTAKDIVRDSKRFYYLQALRATLIETGKQNVLDGMGTQLEVGVHDLDSLIEGVEKSIQNKFDDLAIISSGLTQVKVVNNDEFTQQALKKMGELPKLRRVERTRLKESVFKFSNENLESVRSSIVIRQNRIRNFKIGASVAVPATAVAICGIGILKPPEVTPIPKGTQTAEAPNVDSYPQVEAAKKENVQLLIDDCNARFANECAEKGITVETTKGVFFGDGNFLFHAVDNEGKHYFWHITGYSKIMAVDSGQDTDGTFYIGPKLDEYGVIKPKPDELLKYLVLDPASVDEQGNLIITYQSDGTPNTAKFFLLAKNNPLLNSIKSAVLVPVETQPQISPEIQTKFDKAGIIVSEMKNAKIEKTGLSITINGKEIVVSNENLGKFVYQENGVTGDIYQFIPVVEKETNNMILYRYNNDTKSWEVLDTLPPVKISADKNNPGQCTYLDVLSGNLARSIDKDKIVFPDDAVNKGWDFIGNVTGSTASIYLVEGSHNAMQLANFCRMPADFLGLKGTIDIATVAVLNPDRSIEFLNFDIGNNRLKLKGIFFDSISGGGFNTGIARYQQVGGVVELESLPLVLIAQKEHNLMVNTLQTTDIVSESMGRIIFTPAKR